MALPKATGGTGHVMCEQMKPIDSRARRMRRIGRAPDDVVDQVLAVIDACLFPAPGQNEP